MTRFENRTEAGYRLSRMLTAEGFDPDAVVAIPRGGVPVARPIAAELDCAFAVVAVEKIRVPSASGLVVGRVTMGGADWIDRSLVRVRSIDADTLAEHRAIAIETARKREARYRLTSSVRPGDRVVVVDDTAATGATATACIRHVCRIVEGALARLATEADELVCLRATHALDPLESHYCAFDPVDEPKEA